MVDNTFKLMIHPILGMIGFCVNLYFYGREAWQPFVAVVLAIFVISGDGCIQNGQQDVQVKNRVGWLLLQVSIFNVRVMVAISMISGNG